jgi:purine nucleosidase
LTNLALAVRLDPLLPFAIKSLVIMGGTLDARGNVPGRPCAEFNFHADPEAAAAVFKEFPHSVIVPWECCLRSAMKWKMLDEWLAPDTRCCKFLRAVREKSRQHVVDDSSGYLPVDPLAAAVLLDFKGVVASDGVSLRHASIELGGTATRGQLVVDWSRLTTHIPNVLLVTHVHLSRYSQLMAAAMKKES